MYTKDFIEKVKSFECVSDVLTVLGGAYIEIYVYYEDFDTIFAYVGVLNQHIINTDYGSFECIPDHELEELMEVIYEYVQTPVEEREEPQKYLFKHKYLSVNFSDTYLNSHTDVNSIDLNSSTETPIVKTHLTIEEAKEIGVTFDDNNEPYEWEMIPVRRTNRCH